MKSLIRAESDRFSLSETDLDEWERAQAETADEYLVHVSKVRPDYIPKKDYEQKAREIYVRSLMVQHNLRMQGYR